MTIAQLEERSGVAYSTISRLETGRRGAQVRTVNTLAETLGVERRELMRG